MTWQRFPGTPDWPKVEYGLLVALIAAVIIATVIALGGEINTAFQSIVDGIPG